MWSLIELEKQSSPLTKSNLQQQIILQKQRAAPYLVSSWNNSTFNLVQQHYGRVSLIESVKYVPRCALVPTLRSLYTAGGKSILLFLSVVVCLVLSHAASNYTETGARRTHRWLLRAHQICSSCSSGKFGHFDFLCTHAAAEAPRENALAHAKISLRYERRTVFFVFANSYFAHRARNFHCH